MMPRSRPRKSTPSEEQIRPEVRQKVHQRAEPRPQESKPKISTASKIFWTVMVFFFISAGAYYLNVLINGGA